MGCGGEGHYTQSNEGIYVNVPFFFKRNILPLPPLGLYSDPSMRLVISFSHPNCLFLPAFYQKHTVPVA